ncbi:hypothetical protein [Methylopila turkensis]|uniref:Uncharacterized protein n=1 Tax=Methylopila turkensis TaxID=1437816 RepID=A0A9W6JPG9_9HYPH|nr:hypothetical protein [Methylopila turkensis]GLK80872.1 hypothetical protein GCM10008174_26130 [Methylopila turkensis]
MGRAGWAGGGAKKAETMAALRGQAIAVLGLDPSLLEATVRRLAREGARLALGAAEADHIAELVAELRWEGAEIAALAIAGDGGGLVEPVVALCAGAFGGVDAVVTDRRSAAASMGVLQRLGVGALVVVAREDERHVALPAGADGSRRGCGGPDVSVVALPDRRAGAALPDAVARAVAFALAAPAGTNVATIAVRPTTAADALRAA